MRANCLLLMCVFSVTCLATAQRSGRITGTVLDENGQVFGEVNVCLRMRSGNNTAITCNLARTDKNGQFEIKNLGGHLRSFRCKEEQGYSIDNQNPGERVDLTAQNPAAEVTVYLRPRGGVLLGSVIDKFTGQPLKHAWINYPCCRRLHPDDHATVIVDQIVVVVPQPRRCAALGGVGGIGIRGRYLILLVHRFFGGILLLQFDQVPAHGLVHLRRFR